MTESRGSRKGCLRCGLLTAALALVGIALGAGLALWEDYIGYTVLWRGHVEETAEDVYSLRPGATYVVTFFLAAGEQERILRIEPSPQRCLGLPQLSIEVSLEDPDGNVAATVPRTETFEGYGGFENCHYRKQVAFVAPTTGTYTLRATPYSETIRRIDFSIRQSR